MKAFQRAFVHTLAVLACWVLALGLFVASDFVHAVMYPWTPIPSMTVIEGGK